MADAYNQMGGRDADTGKDPNDDEASDPVPGDMPEEDSEKADRESEESFPASDPPANY